jgi:hypothetical protein
MQIYTKQVQLRVFSALSLFSPGPCCCCQPKVCHPLCSHGTLIKDVTSILVVFHVLDDKLTIASFVVPNNGWMVRDAHVKYLKCPVYVAGKNSPSTQFWLVQLSMLKWIDDRSRVRQSTLQCWHRGNTCHCCLSSCYYENLQPLRKHLSLQ